MIIIPSIDLYNGACVRLIQGNFAKQTTYPDAPAYVANQYKKQGAQALHIVDLQGAKTGQLMQLSLIAAIVDSFGDGVQAGGGIRNHADIEALLTLGVSRVVMGTRAVTQPENIQSWIKEYGTQRLVFALDFRLKNQVPYLATSGWQADTQQTLWQLLDTLPEYCHVLCTDIGQDGMQQGPNFAMYQACVQRYPKLYFQASGGISRLGDIQALKQQKVSAAIVGKALYAGTFNVSEAIACLNDV